MGNNVFYVLMPIKQISPYLVLSGYFQSFLIYFAGKVFVKAIHADTYENSKAALFPQFLRGLSTGFHI